MHESILLRLLPIAILYLLVSCQKQENNGTPSSTIITCDIENLLETISQVDNCEQKATVLENALKESEYCSLEQYSDSIANMYRLIGICFYNNGQNEIARKYYQKGIEKNPSDNMLGRLYTNYGLSYHSEGEYYLSLAYFDNALHFKPVSDNEPYFIKSLTYIGDSYLNLGQLHTAEQYLQQAFDIVSKEYSGYLTEICAILSNCKRNLKHYKSAINIGKLGITALADAPTWSYAEFQYLSNCYLHVGNAWQDSMLLHQANSERWKDAGDSAIYYTIQALGLYKDNGFKINELTTNLNLGELYRRQHKPQKAYDVLNEAISKLKSLPYGLEEAELLGNLYLNRGESLMDMGQFNRADSDLDSALYHLTMTYQPNSSSLVPSLSDPIINANSIIMAINDKATLKIRQSQLVDEYASVEIMEEALGIYDSLVEYSKRIRKEFLTEYDKVKLVQTTNSYLNNAFLLCLKLNNYTNNIKYIKKAFELSELSKSNALLSTLREKITSDNLSETKRQQRKKLIEKRNRLHEDLFKNRSDKVRTEQLKKEWAKYIGEWRKFLESSPVINYQISNLKNKSVKQFQQDILDSNQALLSYHEIDSFLYVFLMSKDSLYLSKEKNYREYQQDIIDIDQILSNNVKTDSLFCEKSNRLYNYLFPDFGVILPNRLIIIPNDNLQSLSFEALWTSSEATSLNTSNVSMFLLFKHAVSYASSANLLWLMNHRNAGEKDISSPETVAAFAPNFPQRISIGDQILPQPIAQSINSLTTIPNEQEINNLKKIVSIKPFIGTEATKSNFWKTCEDHRIIHISTHGLLYNEDPRFNFISFSQSSDTANTDEFLYMQDLYNRVEKLDLELVVLSACETGRGISIKSEGNSSLARGLAAAGVRSFITTLWKVNTDDTNDLMPLFYKKMIENENIEKDVAMQEAKISFIYESLNNINPYSWAGFTLTGNTESLELKKANKYFSWKWLLLLVILSVTIITVWLRNIRL